jgi:hypothetical protein
MGGEPDPQRGKKSSWDSSQKAIYISFGQKNNDFDERMKCMSCSELTIDRLSPNINFSLTNRQS